MQVDVEWARSWLDPERLGPLLHLLKIAFLLLTSVFLLALIRGPAREPTTPRFRAQRLFFVLLAAGLGAIYAYQATWQLAGFARPEFVDFMRKYNRRPENPAKKMVRGEIRDRNGAILAMDDPADATRRVYPFGAATCHVVGYHDPKYGMTGIEAADHPFLEGTTTATPEERERFGRNLLSGADLYGNDLQLTIDVRLQQEATRLLAGVRGAAVALDPRTGDILALASAPAFDPSRLQPSLFTARGEDSALLNRAIQGLYPPGSTFKIVAAAAALEQGSAPVLDCPPEGFVPARGTQPIRDHEYYAAARRGRSWGGHGRIGLPRAMAKSSNVYFAQLGVSLGAAGLAEQAARFHFNEDIVLLDGSAGRLVAKAAAFPDVKPGDRGAAAQLAIGQGRLVGTPFQMAMIGAAVANNGRLMRPRLLTKQAPELLGAAMTPASAKKLREILRGVVADGTARAADLSGLAVAGKTGTAQTPRGEDHAWFLCMAPANRPTIVVVALVEHGGFGSTAALPVAVGLLKKAQDIGWFGGAP